MYGSHARLLAHLKHTSNALLSLNSPSVLTCVYDVYTLCTHIFYI